MLFHPARGPRTKIPIFRSAGIAVLGNFFHFEIKDPEFAGRDYYKNGYKR